MRTRPLLLAALTSFAATALGACRVEPDTTRTDTAQAEPSLSAGEEAAHPGEEAEGSIPGPWQEFVRPSDADLRARLSAPAYRVTQQAGTEAPFTSELEHNEQAGLYVDVVSGEPLFSSRDKFDSGTGWPSFTRPVSGDALARDTDYHLGYARTEVRSAHANSHLGHVFEDGPAPTGLRYCINGAALRFVPAKDLEAAGYGELAPLFE